MTESNTNFLAILRSIAGHDGVLTEDELHSRSAGWAYAGEHIQAESLVRPRTTDEVSRILAACHHAGRAVVPQGGMTGLVEGCVTAPTDVALSLERMSSVEELDEDGLTITVQAGVVLHTVQELADAKGFLFPLDLGARGSATIGGLISTNAGGNNVIRYGMMRSMVLGIEAVLADGTVISSMHPLMKNNSGYDLKQLFIGSEGTLGVVTRAVLRLMPKPLSQCTALVALTDFVQAPRLLRRISAGLGGTLTAFELMWNDFYRLVSTPPARQMPMLPQTFPIYVLIDARGSDAVADQRRFEDLLMQCMDEGLVAESAVAMSGAERRAIWALRDDVEQFLRYPHRCSFDVSLPIRCMDEYVAAVRRKLGEAWQEHVCLIFGHMGDGNLHLVIDAGTGNHDAHHRVEEIVYGSLPPDVSSVSAEHGIGLEKRGWLSLCRTDQELTLMRMLKGCLDPKRILNPGKIFS